jgi:hypothetical protein
MFNSCLYYFKMEKMKPVQYEFQVLNQSATIKSDCNGVMFINQSTIDTVQVNGTPILPGQTLSLNGNENEIDETIYNITLVAVPDPNTFFIITKFYK